MKSQLILTAACLTCWIPVHAQSVPEEPTPDSVLEAIREFNRRSKSVPNEVTVVLEPPADDEAAQPTSEPLLVIGKPPENLEKSDAEEKKEEEDSEPSTLEEGIEKQPVPEPEPEKGLSITVEQIKTGTGTVNPDDVKLNAPFPAKPLSPPPTGWRLDTLENTPPFSREVEISPGTKITLSIRPHSLLPEVDGVSSFSISEPGYDPALGYNQTATVGAALAKSIDHLDEDALRMSAVIDQLQQLLVSLPKPAEPPAAKSPDKR
jgi:hypothetical protein